MADGVEVVMPQMGVSVSEGTITKWLKQEGEEIQADEPLLEISTDKVDTEVPSPGTGVVTQILVPEGETVVVGTTLAVIGEGAARRRPAGRRPHRSRLPPTARGEPEQAAQAAAAPAVAAPESAAALPQSSRPRPDAGNGKTFVSPGRRPHRRRARRRRRPGSRHRPGRPRDEEGHHRVRRLRARRSRRRPRSRSAASACSTRAGARSCRDSAAAPPAPRAAAPAQPQPAAAGGAGRRRGRSSR